MENKTCKQFLAGAISGAVTKTCCAPLERVKIIFQLQGMRNEQSPKYTGILQTLRTVCKEDGYKGLFKGNSANVIRVAPSYALKFALNDIFRDLIAPGIAVNQLSNQQLMAAGSLAGLGQIITTYPLDNARTRLAMAAPKGVQFNGIADCFVSTIRHEGFGALYKGIGPTLLSGPIYVGIQMTLYEKFKQLMPNDKHPVLWKLGCGTVAGLCAQSIMFPGDTVRRRMQVNGIRGHKQIYTSSWNAFVSILKKEGIRGFYKGIGTNVVRGIPSATIQFAVYDLIKSFIL